MSIGPTCLLAVLLALSSLACTEKSERKGLEPASTDAKVNIYLDMQPEVPLDASAEHDAVYVRLPPMVPKSIVIFHVDQRGADMLIEAEGHEGMVIDEVNGLSGRETLVWQPPPGKPAVVRIDTVQRSQTPKFSAHFSIRKRPTQDELALWRAHSLEAKARKIDRSKGDSAESIRLWTEAVAVWRELKETLQVAQATERLARAYDLHGDMQRAMVEHRRVPTLVGPEGEASVRARAQIGIARGMTAQGDIDQAISAYRAAIALGRGIGADLLTAKALHNLALIHVSRDEFAQALKLFEESLATFAKHDKEVNVATEYTGIAAVHAALGDAPLAARMFRQGLEVFRRLRFRWDEGYTTARIGALQVNGLGETQAGVETLKQAIALSTKVGDLRTVVFAKLALGSAYTKLGRYDDAISTMDQVIQELQERNEEERLAEALLIRTNAALLRGTIDLAENSIRAGRQRAVKSGRVSLEAQFLAAEAELLSKSGNRDHALAKARAAVELAEGVRAKLDARRHRAAYAAPLRKLYDRYITILMRSKDGVAMGLQVADQARARVHFEEIEARRWPSDTGNKARREFVLKRELVDRAERALQLAASDQERSTRKRELADALRAYERARDRVSPTRPPANSDRALRPVRGATILEYYLGEERSYLWLLDEDGLVAHVLPARAKIEVLVREFYNSVHARSPASVGTNGSTKAADAAMLRSLQDLSSVLLAPVKARLGAARLLVVSDGALHSVPFSALPHPESGLPLIERSEVVRVARARRPNRPRRSPPSTLVSVLADPVFSAADSRVPRDKRRASSGLSRLRFSRAEAEMIKQLAPKSSVALDFAANQEWLRSAEVSTARILHLATHGNVDSQHPELSSLSLSHINRDAQDIDGTLRLHEIRDLDLRAELVVLSGCETALGREFRGEGTMGLTQAFSSAGAKQIIASYWQVQDRATARLMKHFYEGFLTQGLRPGQSLRQASNRLRQESGFESPYFWAAFELHGWPAGR